MWPGAARFGLAVFLGVCAALVLARAPAPTMACVWGTLDGAALVCLLIAAVMLACVAIDLVALVRQARGDDPALMDLTFTANEGPGAPVAVSRAVKWLFLYPCFIGPCLFVLWHAPAPACA